MVALVPLSGVVRLVAEHTPASTAEVFAQPARASGSARKSTGATTHIAAKIRTITVASKPSASLGPLEHIVQTLNNCGPASVAEVLAYWHIYRTQAQVQAVLRADNSYWGMTPVDLPVYVHGLGMRALVAYGGSEKLVKLAIANGFPVIVSQFVSASFQVRHYRPIEAYNDRTQTFVSADPYLGAGHVISYREFNAIWAVSGYRFQIIYPPALQVRLTAVLRAAGWNKTRTYSQAILRTEARMRTSEAQSAGSWLRFNGYADIAFDEAQIGLYRKAEASLSIAAQRGESDVVIGWVRADIRLLQQHG